MGLKGGMKKMVAEQSRSSTVGTIQAEVGKGEGNKKDKDPEETM